ncbi:hypothetical protein KAH81_00055 [bacterium]|nr:hypothetical protein [bacterium]
MSDKKDLKKSNKDKPKPALKAPQINIPEGFDLTHKRNALGISIEEDRIIALQALISGKSISISSADEEKFQPGIVKNGRIENPAAIVTAFKTLKKRAKFNAYVASINIPSHFFTLKEFDTPEGYFVEDNDNLQWEMGQHINDNPASYKIRSVQTGEGKIGQKILAVASRTGFLDERMRLLISLGLSPCAIEPDIIAAYNALSVIFIDYPSDKFLIVDISAPFTSFCMVVNGDFIPGGLFHTPKEVISGEDGAFELAQVMTQAFNKHFAIHGYVLGKKSPEMLIASGCYAEAYLVSQMGNYMNMQVFDTDPFKSSWVDISKLKTTVPWPRLIKPFGMAMRSPYV